MFFNELDLLEVRLNELASVVDLFVLVECNITHSGQPKPYYFDEHKTEYRFRKFRSKIVHYKVDDLPSLSDYPNHWLRENAHRNRIQNAIEEHVLLDSDIILISDADELPRASSIDKLRYEGLDKPIALMQAIHYYWLNCYNHSEWRGTVACPYRLFKQHQPQFFRDTKDYMSCIADAGWHFAYLGGEDKIKQKLASFAHQEYNLDVFTSSEYIQDKLTSGTDFYNPENQLSFREIDTSYPLHIRQNIGRFQHLINQKQ